MPLPDDYLRYPHRKHGLDNPHYEWAPADRREAIALKDGSRSIATIVIPVEFFPLNPPATPFKHPGAMKTPYPDLRHYTVRDYGNRIGIYRLLRELSARDLKATFAINAEIAKRYPPLIEAIEGSGQAPAYRGTAYIVFEDLPLDAFGNRLPQLSFEFFTFLVVNFVAAISLDLDFNRN